jgi:predicted alpha/beta superfamily hydrolase
MQNISTTPRRQIFQVITISAMITILSVSAAGQQFRYTTNNPVIKNYTISSKILKEDRKISIYRPEVFPEYANAVSPVIYVLDGEAYINFFASFVNMVCERFVQFPPITVVSMKIMLIAILVAVTGILLHL